MTEKHINLNFMRIQQVCKKTGLSKATIYRLMKTGNFPESKKLSERARGWIENEIDGWNLSRESSGLKNV
jgi:prophage regulatory protein